MVKVSIIGGLGNQLFQYAFGRAISEKYGEKLYLDLFYIKKGNFLRSMTVRSFELDNYLINSNKMSVLESLLLRKFDLKNKFVEKDTFFDKSVFKDHFNWFVGYWQSYKYFNDIRDKLLVELIPKKLSSESIKLAEQIDKCNSVSIHIRRGDYLNKTNSNFFFDLVNSNYYKDAIKLISKKIKKPVFFVFSDDLLWVKSNMDFGKNKVNFVDFNKDKNAFEDIYLMSRCKHNIIANSTFSWWGAWLNQNKNCLTIAPKKWFFDKNKSTKDLIPKSWVRI